MKRLRLLLLLLLIPLAALGGFAIWVNKELKAPHSHTKSTEYIEIPRGASPTETLSKLASLGVIRRSWPLALYLKLTGRGARLKAGEYRFRSPVTPLEVLNKLEEGEERLRKFTVIEGWTRWDIADALVRVPELKLENRADAMALLDDVKLIDDIDPRAQNLEGYLYPDTYSFPLDITARQTVSLLTKRFRQVWQPEWTTRAKDLNLSVRQIVTIASLIETEAKLPEERPIIASVIYNRLKINMALGIDSTVIYASKLAGKWKYDGKVYQSDLDRRSPYNTRLNTGLPPGPIASPSSSSLEAALFPATTDYLYYVREPSRDDGAHNFYSSESEFSRGVQALRNWERERDAAQRANPQSTPPSN
jgi:UPF0755 protein